MLSNVTEVAVPVNEIDHFSPGTILLVCYSVDADRAIVPINVVLPRVSQENWVLLMITIEVDNQETDYEKP